MDFLPGCFAISSLMMGNAVWGFVPNPVLLPNTSLTMEGLNEVQAWDEIYERRLLYATSTGALVGIFLVHRIFRVLYHGKTL